MKWSNFINNRDLQHLIELHENDDPANLALKWANKKELPVDFLLTQIKCRQRAKSKIPTWYTCKSIVYPDIIALEQCSSELTANYKAKNLKNLKIADLTGGLGIDSAAFANCAKSVTYVEPVLERIEIAKYNFKELGFTNISFVHSLAEDAVNQFSDKEFDVVYLDPSRRDQTNRRSFRLVDLHPNIISLLDQLHRIASKIIVKVGPMLDIHEAIRDLKGLEKISIISVKDECKEMILYAGEKNTDNPIIECVELSNTQNWEFVFTINNEKNLTINTKEISNYIYDPFASIIKAGAFKSISKKYDISALNANTHIYTSTNLLGSFPGKIYKVEHVLEYNLKKLKSLIPDLKATLVFRNFPIKANDVIKQLKFTSHQENYLFFITDFENRPKVIYCKRIIL